MMPIMAGKDNGERPRCDDEVGGVKVGVEDGLGVPTVTVEVEVIGGGNVVESEGLEKKVVVDDVGIAVDREGRFKAVIMSGKDCEMTWMTAWQASAIELEFS